MSKKVSKQKKKKTMERCLNGLSRNAELLTFGALTAKNIDANFRRNYLKKASELFTIDELVKKWKTSKTSIEKFYISNNLSIFEGKNQLEREINFMMNSGRLKYKEVRQILINLIGFYNTNSVLNLYNITKDEMNYYCDIFNLDLDFYETDNCPDISDTFSFVDSESKTEFEKTYKKKEENNIMKTTETIKITKVDKDGLILSTEYKEIPKDNTDYDKLRSDLAETKKKYMTPMSIISFLKLPEKERRDRLDALINDYGLENCEIEKILGIPSGDYLRKLKCRHLIFDFNAKGLFKPELRKFKTFEECQKFTLDIIQNNRYKEFKIPEKSLDSFARRVFDVDITASGEARIIDWETFCNRIIKQAIYVYKKNSRVTNLTKEEVLEFEKNNRKVISNKDLIRVTRTVIKDIYDDHQPWISIFDFKTAIEKEGFELDSNDKIIETVDRLIEKNSFKNDFFSLKKIELENPILSNESSIRWEFINTKPTNLTKTMTEIDEDILPEEDFFNNIPDEKITINKSEPSEKKEFLNSNTISLSFNEENTDEVIEYIKQTLKMFGNGFTTISISKLD